MQPALLHIASGAEKAGSEKLGVRSMPLSCEDDPIHLGLLKL
jgi:hypothetical protein